MRKNKISLSSFLGINLIAMSIMAFAATITFILNSQSRSHFNNDSLILISVSLFLGGGFLLTSIGFFFKKKWARHALNLILFLTAAIFAISVYLWASNFVLSFRWRFQIVQLSMFILIASTLSGVFLFLNNVRVIEELEKDI